MSKFFVDPSAVCGAHIYMENKDDLHHLRKVLRGLLMRDGVLTACAA